MKAAFAVALTDSVRKTEDRRDLANYQIWIRDTRYYSKDSDRVNGQYPKTVRSARPMSQECATKLATELKKSFASEFWDTGTAHEVKVIEIVADDDQYLPETLDELKAAVDEPPGITLLKSAVENCLKSGMGQSEVRDLCRSEVSGAARLRIAIQECLVDARITNILEVVNHVIQEKYASTL